MTATLTKWYEEHGRHEIFAGGKKVGMASTEHDLLLNDVHVKAAANDSLDKLGIAKNSREEKMPRTRRQAEAGCGANVRRWRSFIVSTSLGEKPTPGLVSLNSIAPAPKPAAKTEEVMGD